MTLTKALDGLHDAALAARDIGLVKEANEAQAVLDRARQRNGFSGAVYVLALAGGTGVGKSALLNALAGHTVSAVRAIRPTTEQPIAWVAHERADEMAPLLNWLGVRRVAGHADDRLSGVAILDLPDFDSVRTEHRAAVDELLPRIDAVAWVLDPEKYDDARLHAYLRGMAGHAGRLRFILNKADRLTPDQRTELVTDLLERLSDSGIREAKVEVVSALSGEGIDGLGDELASEGTAKALVTAKLMTDAVQARNRLIQAVGLEPKAPFRPLMPSAVRRDAVDSAVEGALALVDTPGLARQIGVAVTGQARWSGGSVLGRVAELLRRLTGQRRRTADPAAYLRNWRRRGTLGRVVNPVRAALLLASASVPSSSRAALFAALGADEMEWGLSQALDRVARDSVSDLHVPRSPLWLAVGVLQLAVAAVFAFAVAWYATLFLSQGLVPVATVDAPILGPLPLPLVLLTGSLLFSAALGLVLSVHAGWTGRRIGARVAERVEEAVGRAVEQIGFGRLDEIELARRKIGGVTQVDTRGHRTG